MAAWEWIEADNHIEWAYDKECVPEDERFKHAVSFNPEPVQCRLLDGTKYEAAGYVISRMAQYDELGQNARTEFIMEELGPAIATS